MPSRGRLRFRPARAYPAVAAILAIVVLAAIGLGRSENNAMQRRRYGMWWWS